MQPIYPEYAELLNRVDLPTGPVQAVMSPDDPSLMIFLDIGDDSSAFLTFGYYITSSSNAELLVPRLRRIREPGGLDRFFKYESKSRHDMKRMRGFNSWMTAVRNSPGIAYVIAFDRRLLEPEHIRSELKEFKSFVYQNKGDSNKNLWRAIGAPSVLSILAKYFREGLRIRWILDRDLILDTPTRRGIVEAVTSGIISRCAKSRPARISYGRPVDHDANPFANEQFREVLSISDLLASSFSNAIELEGEEKKLRLHTVDESHESIMRQFAEFQATADSSATGDRCALGISIIKMNFNNGGEPILEHHRPRPASFRPTAISNWS